MEKNPIRTVIGIFLMFFGALEVISIVYVMGRAVIRDVEKGASFVFTILFSMTAISLFCLLAAYAGYRLYQPRGEEEKRRRKAEKEVAKRNRGTGIHLTDGICFVCIFAGIVQVPTLILALGNWLLHHSPSSWSRNSELIISLLIGIVILLVIAVLGCKWFSSKERKKIKAEAERQLQNQSADKTVKNGSSEIESQIQAMQKNAAEAKKQLAVKEEEKKKQLAAEEGEKKKLQQELTQCLRQVSLKMQETPKQKTKEAVPGEVQPEAMLTPESMLMLLQQERRGVLRIDNPHGYSPGTVDYSPKTGYQATQIHDNAHGTDSHEVTFHLNLVEALKCAHEHGKKEEEQLMQYLFEHRLDRKVLNILPWLADEDYWPVIVKKFFGTPGEYAVKHILFNGNAFAAAVEPKCIYQSLTQLSRVYSVSVVGGDEYVVKFAFCGLSDSEELDRIWQQLQDVEGLVKNEAVFYDETHRCRITVMPKLQPITIKNGNRTATAYAVAKQIGKTLQEMHKRGILHGDISAENLYMTKNAAGETKYLLGDLDEMTQFGVTGERLRMNPWYVPVEVWDKNERYDASAELYSLGVLLYSICNRHGLLPLCEESSAQAAREDNTAVGETGLTGREVLLQRRRDREDPAAPTDCGQPELLEAMRCLLQYEKQDRLRTAGAFLRMLATD